MSEQPIERREFVAGTVAARTAKPSAGAAPAAGGEAIIDYAAMRLLGHERAIAEPALARVGLKGGRD